MTVHFLDALNLLNSPVFKKTSPLVRKGNNRNYSYEIWSTPGTFGYYLKVYPNSQAPQVVGSFKTSQDAFNYLNNNYR
ncbi:hypothetical protein NIES4071_49180 [Calothrix sp. NIES-4071]|nr:hypothetical protein NIES4071_49180 [Calothrix sp. NIES-4071]BAZ59230.1 hypothetical protein NIES4105_49120 [Calothrix sp. NIES-4105]